MAQYDPIVVKTGVPGVLGADALRAEQVAVAGFTTAPVAAGDVCQLNGALTLQKASAGMMWPVVGVYDGVSGSLVREGIVQVSVAAGVALANGDPVYLSFTYGAVTNVKPITDALHEVGVVVDAASRKIYLQPRPPVALPTGYVWVMNATEIDASQMSAVTGTKAGDTVALAGGAWDSCYDGAGNVWITSCVGGGNIYKVNAATRAVLMTIPSPAGAPNIPTGICSDGTYVYVVIHVAGTGKVYQYRIADGAVGWNATVGNNPYHPCYDNVNGCVWVPGYLDNYVTKVRVSDGGVVGSYATLAGPFHCTFDGVRVWVTQRGGAANTVRRFTAATGASLGDVTVGNDPVGGCYGDGYYYTANRADGTISKVTAATGVVAATYGGAAGGYFPCYDGVNVWVPSITLNNVTKVRAADGALIGSYATGATAQSACSTARRLPWT